MIAPSERKEIEQTVETLRQLRLRLSIHRIPSRQQSMALTKMDEAVMWLEDELRDAAR